MKSTAGPKTALPNLEFLQEPALLVELDGSIRSANAAARDLFKGSKQTANLFDIVNDERAAVATYLRRASGSTSSHLGALEIRNGDGIDRFRAHAARMSCGETAGTLLIVRLMPVQDDRFVALNRRLREVDGQLHQRLKENAMLVEALTENKVLVRELQHRVKNNIQQMLSLIKVSAAQRPSPDVVEVVATASRRLRAMAMTQEAIYQNESAASLSAQSFLEDIAKGVADSFESQAELLISIEDAPMTSEEAHCLALIACELITNAFKYGVSESDGRVSVRYWSYLGNRFLEVHDNGSGIDERAMPRASGLRLVRSLCRQIGGKLEIANEIGAKLSVQFRSEIAQEQL
jgi:two-component sensor histidine kinase